MCVKNAQFQIYRATLYTRQVKKKNSNKKIRSHSNILMLMNF